MEKPLIQVNNVFKRYNDMQVINDVSFKLNIKQVLTIIGPNGGGKTTLAKIILNLIKPDRGEVIISPHIKIGYVPQKFFINNNLPLSVKYFLKLSATNLNKLNEVTKQVGVEKLLDKQMHDISGGELQKVMLAKALVGNPDLIILDEPVQGIDLRGQAEFYDLIDNIRASSDISIIMISHDLHMVMRSTDYVICLNHHISCQGSPMSINNHPEYLNLFPSDITNKIAIYAHHHHR